MFKCKLGELSTEPVTIYTITYFIILIKKESTSYL